MGKDSGGSIMKEFTSRGLHDAIGQALAEVSRRLAAGELDQSGRYYTDEELAAGAATGVKSTVPRRIGPVAARPKRRRSAVSG